MNQEELNQWLVELLDQAFLESDDNFGRSCTEQVANYLIASGVIIRERGEWIKRTQGSEPECSRCGRCPKLVFGMLPDFCPHCGADMRGVKDENGNDCKHRD